MFLLHTNKSVIGRGKGDQNTLKLFPSPSDLA